MASSKKNMSLICKSLDLSEKSQLNNKYGVIIAKGSKIFSKGFNSNRSYVDNKLVCSLHAEIDAVNKWLGFFHKKYGKVNNYKNSKQNYNFLRQSKKFNIYLGRENFHDCMPCQDCLMKIKSLGLNFLYTIQKGSIVKYKIKDMKNTYYTDAQEYYKNNKYIKY